MSKRQKVRIYRWLDAPKEYRLQFGRNRRGWLATIEGAGAAKDLGVSWVRIIEKSYDGMVLVAGTSPPVKKARA